MATYRPYHTLLLHDGERWCVEFGDYDLECVKSERDEYRRDHAAKTLKIITTGAGQADIETAVTKLNDWRNGEAA